MARLNARQVRAEFRRWWAARCEQVPAYRTDKPAKRMAFSCFVDDLARCDRVSERVAFNVTMEA